MMRLINADGSAAELSGNGLRALAAIVIRHRGIAAQVVAGAEVLIGTDAGPRLLTLVERNECHGSRSAPAWACRRTFGGSRSRPPVKTSSASVFSMGNPQCVMLGPLPDDERFDGSARPFERHAAFPHGTNVEFAARRCPRPRAHPDLGARRRADRLVRHGRRARPPSRPIAYGGARAPLDVVAPGGTPTRRVDATTGSS